MKTVTMIQKPTDIVTSIDVQYDEEIVVMTNGNEVTLNEDDIANLFQDTFSEEEQGTR